MDSIIRDKMLKTRKFNKRLKTQTKNERENTKSNFPLETSSSTGTLNTLAKINRTEEDLIFKSERKIPDEKDIYDIENKIDLNECNKNDDYFERENYISNRDIAIPKKIAPTIDSVINIQKEIKDKKREIEESAIKVKEQEKIEKKKDNNKTNFIFTSQDLFLIIFITVLVVVGIFVILFFLFFVHKKKD